MDDFRQIAGRIHDAASYRDVFLNSNEVKTTYRQIARVVHPDKVAPAHQAEASVVFSKLGQLRAAAERALQNGTFYTKAPTLVFESAHMRHEVYSKLQNYFDMTTGYRARSCSGAVTDSIIKVAQTPRDNDLLAAEAEALKLLANTGVEHAMFFPTLLDSFAVADGHKRLRANAITWLDGFVNLEQVRTRYSAGLNPLDTAWIWRRILWALGGAHNVGVLHGALVPSNILIHPALHGVVLADWCYSALKTDKNYPKLKAVVGNKRDWYPPGILKREAPTTAHDIAFAARSMRFLMDGTNMPDVMEQYFQRLEQGNKHGSAYELLAQFDGLLERLGAPYYPRVFRPLNW